MKKKISSQPERFYALHMAEGLAEYKDDKGPYKILLKRDVLNKMDPTFTGCPVYVGHEDDVDLKNLDMSELDGMVVRSFYNQADGNHWAEFMAFTDAAKEAIRQKKWKVSNCYNSTNAGGGKWQGSEYRHEIRQGKYDHLAIVPNPRYTQSMVLTPDEFKAYNAEKNAELTKIANSDDSQERGNTVKTILNIFKREKVQNADINFDELEVTLPKSGKTVALTKIVNDADEKIQNAGKPCYSNDDDIVKMDNEEMSVAELKKAYNEMKKEKEENDEGDEKELSDEKKKKGDEGGDGDDKKKNAKKKNADKKKNDDDEEEDRIENEDDTEDEDGEEDAPKKGETFNKIKNAQDLAARRAATEGRAQTGVFGADRVKVGQTKYGSGTGK